MYDSDISYFVSNKKPAQKSEPKESVGDSAPAKATEKSEGGFTMTRKQTALDDAVFRIHVVLPRSRTPFVAIYLR